MKRTFAVLSSASVCLMAAGMINMAQQKAPSTRAAAPPPAAQRPADDLMPLESQNALLRQYCQGCHNDTAKRGNMTLTSLDLAHLDQNPDLAEKIIKKLKTGLMPPASSRRPEGETVKAFVRVLESQLDKAAALRPNPGTRPFQRLTRDEYARSIRDLLGIDVDVEKYLPADTLSDGLDNIADSQMFSPSLMEGYIRAAAQISREALGDPKAEPGSTVYKIPRTGGQLRHVAGAPLGTRGGISVMFNFIADGEYSFRSLLHGNPTGALFGNLPDEQIDVSIDGERVALVNIDTNISETRSVSGLNLSTGRIFLKAGAHRVSAAFIQKYTEIVVDDIAELEHSLVDTDIARDRELTVYTHLREFEITGPYNVSGVSDTPTRRKVFTCRPLSPDQEVPCSTRIINDLARQAFRRPSNPEDMEGLMNFYSESRKRGGDFETGIRTALQAILASPDFVFKFEPPPALVKPGQNYRIGDLALASRLSYFLWGTIPDEELVTTANQGKLKDPLVLEKQVRRMLADPRSSWLATKFAGQWLHLRDLSDFHPDPFYYPQFDYTLGQSLLRETELFFESIVREDRNVVDLLTASYTFLDERAAIHYGFGNVRGNQFRRVELTDDNRRGLLGKGAILALTSVADRTSPVLRGKWVMGVLLGTPPPPPPPAVPKLEETAAVASGKILTVRERMEIHRSNPACTSCHQMIDPIGLALENFDVTGEWRTWDKTYAISPGGVRVHTPGIPIDATTRLYDGTPLDGPASLRQALLKYSDAFVENLTEKLLTFAIGRRLEHFDMPLIRAIDREAARSNNRFSSLILGIVKSPAFQMSRAEQPATESSANKD